LFMPTPLYFRAIAFAVSLGFNLPSFAQNPAPVVVVVPETQSAQQTIELSGTARAAQISAVSARVAGAVEQVLVDDGSRVESGEVLLKLDEKLEQAELARLQAELTRAQTEEDEALRLVSEANRLSAANHIPATEVALRKARLASAQAAVEAVRAQITGQQQRLQYHTIVAPFAGVVTNRLAELGEWVTQGAAVVELVDTEKSFVDVEIPQADFYRLNSDTRVEIRPDTRPGLVLPATIATGIPVANAATRTFRLRLLAENAGNALPPGTSATANFYITSSGDNVLTIPRDALLRNPDNSFAVFVVDSEQAPAKALRVPIEVGQTLGTRVEVLAGLLPTSQVVVRGNEILNHDQPVTLVRQTTAGQ
jgi:RND family efflux transporter MFP subunit